MALAYVNTATGSTNGTGASQATNGLNVTTGNLLVGFMIWAGATRTMSNVTDTAGNTWVQAPGAFNTSNGAGGDRIDIWYCENAIGNASNVMTMNLSGSAGFLRIIVNQYSGAATSGALDVATTGYTANGISVTSNNLVTSQADEVLVIATSSDSTHTSYTAGGGFTKRGSIVLNDSQSADMIVSSTGTYTGTLTGTTGSTVFYMSAAAFKAPPTGPPPNTAVSAWLTA